MRLCASFAFRSSRFRLRDVARSRGARALAVVMAFALSIANVLAFAMPVSAHHDAHGVASHATPHAGCAHHDQHGAGSSCCLGKACVCVHLCGDVPSFDAVLAVVIPRDDSSASSTPRPYATISVRLLRPPIA